MRANLTNYVGVVKNSKNLHHYTVFAEGNHFLKASKTTRLNIAFFYQDIVSLKHGVQVQLFIGLKTTKLQNGQHLTTSKGP